MGAGVALGGGWQLAGDLSFTERAVRMATGYVILIVLLVVVSPMAAGILLVIGGRAWQKWDRPSPVTNEG